MGDNTATKQDTRPPTKGAPPGTPSDPSIVSHVENVWSGILARSRSANDPSGGIYGILIGSHATIISAARGRIVAHLPLSGVHLNSKSILHGAVSATLIDWSSGLAVASMGLDQTGVSTDMHISYVSTARGGDTLEIEAHVSKLGKTLAYTTVEIRKASPDGIGQGDIVTTGSHTKYLSFKPSPTQQTSPPADAKS
ncbi:HotDog domain-containing protein [Diplogelasinospora grovesii]|uniref:HotDog domain-containing protein n=1 Tax=Diplogelasinospora grovesii TaxID=303347 RepID=A0AAN6N4M5_9PEZI|nr:HotDog domain-containing protein [Diplogelasinospora grovesii]